MPRSVGHVIAGANSLQPGCPSSPWREIQFVLANQLKLVRSVIAAFHRRRRRMQRSILEKQREISPSIVVFVRFGPLVDRELWYKERYRDTAFLSNSANGATKWDCLGTRSSIATGIPH